MSNGKSTCDEIARQKNYGKVADIGKAFVDAINPAKWLEALGNKATEETTTTNITNMNLKMEDIKKIQEECRNETAVEQVNKISQSPECIREYGTLCSMLSSDAAKLDCIRQSKIENITQSNALKSQSKCVINKVIDTLTQQSPTVENVAKLIAVQEQSGLMNKNESITNNCNEVNQNISSTNFLENVTNCINKVSAKQKNALKVCGASNITQSNMADMIGDCLMKSGITTKNIATVYVGSDVKKEVTQKSSNTVILIVIFIIIGIIAVVGIIFGIKYMKNKKGATGVPQV